MQKDVSGNQSNAAAQPAGAYVAGSLGLQRKLTVGREDDPQEREADAAAEQVLRMDHPGAGRSAEAAPKPVVQPGSGTAAAIQRDGNEEEERQRGISFLPPLGVSGQWSRLGFDLGPTDARLMLGDPQGTRLTLGTNYTSEAYMALQARRWAFQMGYNFATSNLYAGGRYERFNFGATAGVGGSGPSFGIALGIGQMPLFNYNMRSTLRFSDTPLPYFSSYADEMLRTQTALNSWQTGGDAPTGALSTIGSMTADLFNAPSPSGGQQRWGAGFNLGLDPQLGFYFMAGLAFRFGSGRPDRRVDRKEAGAIQHPSESGGSNETLAVSAALEHYIGGLEASGEALPPSLQDYFGEQLGYDFSEVRIHTGSEASESAESIQAKAYTTDRHIVFGEGEYAPETAEGRRLLTHELTHVVQQSGGTLRKKESAEKKPPASLEDELRAKLDLKQYDPALAQLNGYLLREGLDKKAWLGAHADLRYRFLRRLPAGAVAEKYSVEELLVLPEAQSFAAIDQWYQLEADKKRLYAENGPLFSRLSKSLSPYTGKPVAAAVAEIMAAIVPVIPQQDAYPNPAFHKINLLAPTVELKIRLFDSYTGLYDKAAENFDPFTGISLPTMEALNEAKRNRPDRALKVYGSIAGLHEEQRAALYQKQAFKLLLNEDKDTAAHYKASYKTYYKAIRRDDDIIAEMEKHLDYQHKDTAGFGFDGGLDLNWDESKGTAMADSAALLSRMWDEANLASSERLGLMVRIGVRAGLQQAMINNVFKPKHAAGKLPQAALDTIGALGFGGAPDFAYSAKAAGEAKYSGGQIAYYIRKTALDFGQGSAFGKEQRGTFDLTALQDKKDFAGSLGGMRFSKEAEPGGDSKYDKEWLEDKVYKHANSSKLKPNVTEFEGEARRGKVYVSIRNDKKEANIYAASLPFEGLNFFGGGSLYRSGPGVLQGLVVHLSWDKDTSEADNTVHVSIGIENIRMETFEMVSPRSTMSVGHIGMKDLLLTMTQRELPASRGYLGFLGIFKNAAFTMNALLTLVPNVLKLLPAAVMAMTEEFMGSAHKSKDALGAVMKNDFNALDASLKFNSLEVRSIYDTTKGFIDDFSIGSKADAGKDPSQEIKIAETTNWKAAVQLQIRQRISGLATEIEKSKTGNVTPASALSQQVKEAEKKQLEQDLNYLILHYDIDDKLAHSKDSGATRLVARQRKSGFDARYKSADVHIDLQNIRVRGGGFLKGIINDSLKAIGLKNPALSGLQDIDIGAFASDFRASGSGTSMIGGKTGLAVRDIHLAAVSDEELNYDNNGITLKAGKPLLEDIRVTVEIDFSASPLERSDPFEAKNYRVAGISVGHALFEGLRLALDGAPPLLAFPKKTPVEVWGISIGKFDPKSGSLDLKIDDISAAGEYRDGVKEKKEDQKAEDPQAGDPELARNHTRAGFGINTKEGGAPGIAKKPAFDIAYDGTEKSVAAKLNIPQVRIPLLDIASEGLAIKSPPKTDAVLIKDIRADVKVFLKREAGTEPARPMSIEVASFTIGEIAAKGITLTMKGAKTEQVVSLPESDQVFIRNISISGLRATREQGRLTLSALKNDAAFSAGATQLSGIGYKEQTLNGGVLKSLRLDTGKFESLSLEALGRNDRQYSLQEFLQFFGRSRLAGLDLKGSLKKGKTSGTVNIAGKKNQAIAIDYVKGGVGGKDHYKIRLPLSRISIPKLHIEEGGQAIDLPKATDYAHTSHLSDVDLKLEAEVNFVRDEKKKDARGEPKEKLVYDVRLQSLEAETLKVFGLKYAGAGLTVEFDKTKPLIIPKIKAGGFRFSSGEAMCVFGAGGGWIEAGGGKDLIQADFERIEKGLENGKFLAEAEGSRSALGLSLASFGFWQDKDGARNIFLGGFSGGFPKMMLTQTGPKGGSSTTTISSKDASGVTAAQINVKLSPPNKETKKYDDIGVSVIGLTAGGLNIVHKDTKDTETSTTTVKLDADAFTADETEVKLHQEKLAEITAKGIRGGRIEANLVSVAKGGKKSVKDVSLPSPDLVTMESVVVKVDADGRKKITLVRPSIKKIDLRMPSQKIPGDYIHVRCDLRVEGNMELGDGNFDSMSFGGTKDAFIAMVQEGVPVTIEKIHFGMRDTDKEKAEPEEKALSPKQTEMLRLEKIYLDAKAAQDKIPERITVNRYSVPNPAYQKAEKVTAEAENALKKQKKVVTTEARENAAKGDEKKYLDAITGNISASATIFGMKLPLTIWTIPYEENHLANFINMTELTPQIKPLLSNVVGQTIVSPFWNSNEIKAIAGSMIRWYTYPGAVLAPSAVLDLHSIARGEGFSVVRNLVSNMDITTTKLDGDHAGYNGLELNINGYWAVGAFNKDIIGIPLVQDQYVYYDGSTWYQLFGFIEQLKYVSSALVSKGKEEMWKQRILATFDKLNKSGNEVTEENVDKEGIKDALMLLVEYIKAGFISELDSIVRRSLYQLKNMELTADVNIKPAEVIDLLMTDRKTGKSNGKLALDGDIEGLHLKGHVGKGRFDKLDADFSLGMGTSGLDNILIPGGRYTSADATTKVQYSGLELSPFSGNHFDSVLKMDVGSALLKGLKIAIRNK